MVSDAAAVTQVKPDASGPGGSSRLNPAKVPSSGKSPTSVHPLVCQSGAGSADAEADEAPGEGAVSGAGAGSPVKKAAAQVVKPALVLRTARSRFKVQPNLAEAGLRRQK